MFLSNKIYNAVMQEFTKPTGSSWNIDFLDFQKVKEEITNIIWKKKDDKYEFSLDIPGYKKSEVSVRISDDSKSVYIGAENVIRGKIKHNVTLPKGVKELKAHLEDGVLTLTSNEIKYKNPEEIKVKWGD